MVKNIVAGALFDFLGFLTSLKEPVTMSGHHEAPIALVLLEEWAAARGLDLDGADVQGWQEEIG